MLGDLIMKVVYPIVITKTGSNGTPYFVNIPDIDSMTQGTTLRDAEEMAKECIGMNILDRIDNNEEIPLSNTEFPTAFVNDIVEFITIDVNEYRLQLK